MEEKQQNKGSKMLLLLTFLMVLLIGAVVGVGAWLITNMNSDNSGGTGQITIGTGPVAVADLEFVQISMPINTNLLTGPDGNPRRISFDFSVAVDASQGSASTEIIRLLREAEPVTRTIAISILRDMTIDQVNSQGGEAQIRRAILDRIISEFGSNLIQDIHVIQIIAQ